MTISSTKILTSLTLLILLSTAFLLNAQKTSKDIFWETGLQLAVKSSYGKDTISLRDMINGSDKTSFILDQNGDTINHAYLNDKVLLLDFWFLACKPCIAEITGFDRLKTKFKDEPFRVITFSPDSHSEIHEKLLSKRDFKFHIISDAHLVARHSYPLKIIINKRGDFKKVKIGGHVGPDAPIRMCEDIEPLILKWLRA